MDKIIEGLRDKKVPETYPNDIDENPLYTARRPEIVRMSSHALVSYRWVEPLSIFISGRPCLEIMSGKGMLARALMDCKVNVIPSDNTKYLDSWCEIEIIDCLEAIKKYIHKVDFLICSWPYDSSPMPEAIELMRKLKPDCRMIYIGEPRGGCCASKKFFEKVTNAANVSFLEVARYFQSWENMNDNMFLFK
jgi:hypothetical protein